MKIIFSLLYKNGHEDVHEQEVTKENEKDVMEVIETIQQSFQDDESAIVTFGDGEQNGAWIRISDVSRVKVRYES